MALSRGLDPKWPLAEITLEKRTKGAGMQRRGKQPESWQPQTLKMQAILLRDGQPRAASSMIFARKSYKQEVTRQEIKDA